MFSWYADDVVVIFVPVQFGIEKDESKKDGVEFIKLCYDS